MKDHWGESAVYSSHADVHLQRLTTAHPCEYGILVLMNGRECVKGRISIIL